MKHSNDQVVETLQKYAYWHCGDEVLARTLVRDALDLAETLSGSDKEFHHRAIRIMRCELRYLDRLECRDWNDDSRGGGDTALHRLLHRLGFEYRDVVVFHLICGYGIQEIANILAVTRRETRRRVAAAGSVMREAAFGARYGRTPSARRSIEMTTGIADGQKVLAEGLSG